MNRDMVAAWKRLEDGFRYRYIATHQYVAKHVRDEARKTIEIIESEGPMEQYSGAFIYRDDQYMTIEDPREGLKLRGMLVAAKEISQVTQKGSRIATIERTPTAERDALGFEVFRPIHNQYRIFGFPWQQAYLQKGDTARVTHIKAQGEGFLVTSRRENAEKPYKTALTCDYDFQPVGKWLLPKSIANKADGVTGEVEEFEWKIIHDLPVPVRMSSTFYVKDPKSGKILTYTLTTFELVDGSFELRKNSVEPAVWDELASAQTLPDLTDKTALARRSHSPSIPSQYMICLAVATSAATFWMVRNRRSREAV